MKTESIFKVGDRVYELDLNLGWGVVSYCIGSKRYPLVVNFDNKRVSAYTSNGCMVQDDHAPSLSFTEYNRVNGGFSQVRPLPDIEIDTLVYVREKGKVWEMRYFSHFGKDGMLFCFEMQKKSTGTADAVYWEEYSLTNPLI